MLYFFLFIIPTNIYAQFLDKLSINTIVATETSGEKPQSKVWRHDANWWAVIPTSSGTHIYRLVGTTWVQGLKISTLTTVQADTKNVGNFTYILLPNGTTSKLVIVVYDSGPQTYSISSTANIDLGSSFVETATIDIDGNGRMWLAYESSGNINVQWSNSPYNAWANSVIVLATGVDSDDISAVTAFDDKIGVMWSDQSVNPSIFGFMNHSDNDPVTTWSNDETPASQSELNIGQGMADDHINFAVGGDGSIYVAVKTGYDTDTKPSVALLVRRPTPVSGSNHWEDLHSVRVQDAINGREATRPIALLDDENNKIYVVYTQDVGGNDIMYKSSSTNNINFDPANDGDELIPKTANWCDATSTKQNFNSEVVILASYDNDNTWTGVLAGIGPFPVELAFFAGALNDNSIELRWRTETEVNNYGFYIERATENVDWLVLGFVEGHGNANSPKQYNFSDNDINFSGEYYYRLKQTDNDGTFEYSDVVTVTVGVPVLYSLSQNYPNPFNPQTRIDYTLPEQQNVSLRVYNMLGELVQELVNEVKPAGTYTITFNASNLPSGIYVYVLKTPTFVSNRKMTFLK